MKDLRICMIGTKFMGRAHSNAYMKVDKFFDVPLRPVMQTVVGRNAGELAAFAKRWGWRNHTTDLIGAVTDAGIDLVDVGTPNNQHKDMTLAALEAGKHIFCEKPLSATLADARAMRDAARKAGRGIKTFVGYNYRRVPAVALARDLVNEGRIGRIYHIRAYYLQDWAGPGVPLIWRFDKKAAGSGSHGDLGAHIIDMARFITGSEFVEIGGAVQETFIRQRILPAQGSKGGIAGGAKASVGRKGKVSVDDATLFLARMKGGAVCTFEATRFATGNQNKNGLEINGEKGSVMFNFEDMNWLSYYDATLPRKVQGWQKIMCTHAPDHPYAHAWWPDAHIVGYEHGFINQCYDILLALAGKKPTVPLADFDDAYKTQQVMEAVERSATERRPVKIAEIE